MPGVKKVIHTCIWVSDIEKTKEFYIQGLGLNLTWGFTGTDGINNFYVSGGEGGAEIQFKYQGMDESAQEQGVTIDRRGMDHLALSVDDVNQTVDHIVEQTGCNIIIEPFQNDETGVRAAFIEDPDGYIVELVQYLENGTNSKV